MAPRLELIERLLLDMKVFGTDESRHQVPELLLVERGSYRKWVAGILHEGGTGTVLYIPAGTHHEGRNSCTDCTISVLQWSGSDLGPDPVQVQDLDGRLAFVFHWLRDLVESTDRADRGAVDAFLPVVFNEFRRLRKGGDSQSDPLERVRAYLRTHCAHPLSHRDLAAVSGMGRSSLIARFGERFGLSPFAYLSRARAERAVELLKATDRPLRDIAREVGLADPSVLSRLVRRHAGRSPRELRRRDGA